jgi:hypothetical protein
MAHEFGHANNYLTPDGRRLMITDPQQEEDDTLCFGQTVAADPATQPEPTAEELEAIETLLEPKREL